MSKLRWCERFCYTCAALVVVAQGSADVPAAQWLFLALSSFVLAIGVYFMGLARGELDGAEQREELRTALAASTIMMKGAETVMLDACKVLEAARCPDCGRLHSPAPPAPGELEH
jgi:hypothetical protein